VCRICCIFLVINSAGSQFYAIIIFCFDFHLKKCGIVIVIWLCVCVCVRARVCAWMYACTQPRCEHDLSSPMNNTGIYVHVYIHTYIYTYIRTYIHTFGNANEQHTYIHTYTRTYIVLWIVYKIHTYIIHTSDTWTQIHALPFPPRHFIRTIKQQSYIHISAIPVSVSQLKWTF